MLANDGFEGDYFGSSVSASADHIVVGAYLSDDNGGKSGSAYVLKRAADGTWSQTQKLIASDAQALDTFGRSVSISANRLIVGADGDYNNGGRKASAYLFEKGPNDDWQEVEKLVSPNGSTDNRFGYSTSISGDSAIVGAFLDRENGITSGSAYIFERSEDGNWTESHKLIASDRAENDSFGYSVAISGDTAIVGRSDDDSGTVAAQPTFSSALLMVAGVKQQSSLHSTAMAMTALVIL